MREIAEVLEIDLPAAKQRLRRGRMALVMALGEDTAHRADLAGVPLRCWDARRHVSEFLDDALEPEVRAQVEAHVAACPTCPALVASLVGTRAALSRIRDPDNVVAPDLAARIRSRIGGVPEKA